MMRLGVIGWPIGHSRSPAMHNAALAALGLDGRYEACAVEPAALDAFVRAAPAAGFRGLNVTIPHKEAVLALCAPDELAARVGAVNTLVFAGDGREGDGGALPRGHNTDVHGVIRLMAEAGARADGHVVVLGAGGAARAVVAALRPTARRLSVVSRRAAPLIVDGVACARVAWEPAALAAAFADADVVIDATPRGLDAAAAPLDLGPLPAHAVVLDLVVAHTTGLTRAAAARGLRAATGTAMLLHQGARAFELWTGRAAPLEVMRAALEAAL